MKQKFSVNGMGCSACVARVEKAVKALEGITSVNVSLIENSMVCEFDETVITSEQIVSAVTDAGYEASPLSEEKKEEEKKTKKKLFF